MHTICSNKSKYSSNYSMSNRNNKKALYLNTFSNVNSNNNFSNMNNYVKNKENNNQCVSIDAYSFKKKINSSSHCKYNTKKKIKSDLSKNIYKMFFYSFARNRGLNVNNINIINNLNNNKIENDLTFPFELIGSNPFINKCYLKSQQKLLNYISSSAYKFGLKLVGNKSLVNAPLSKSNYSGENLANIYQNILKIKTLNHICSNENSLNLMKESNFLTPFPMKSEKLIKSNEEKELYSEAKKCASFMRRLEYNYGIANASSIEKKNEHKTINIDKNMEKIINNNNIYYTKEDFNSNNNINNLNLALIYVMKGAVLVIEDWWKKILVRRNKYNLNTIDPIIARVKACKYLKNQFNFDTLNINYYNNYNNCNTFNNSINKVKAQNKNNDRIYRNNDNNKYTLIYNNSERIKKIKYKNNTILCNNKNNEFKRINNNNNIKSNIQFSNINKATNESTDKLINKWIFEEFKTNQLDHNFTFKATDSNDKSNSLFKEEKAHKEMSKEKSYLKNYINKHKNLNKINNVIKRNIKSNYVFNTINNKTSKKVNNNKNLDNYSKNDKNKYNKNNIQSVTNKKTESPKGINKNKESDILDDNTIYNDVSINHIDSFTPNKDNSNNKNSKGLIKNGKKKAKSPNKSLMNLEHINNCLQNNALTNIKVNAKQKKKIITMTPLIYNENFKNKLNNVKSIEQDRTIKKKIIIIQKDFYYLLEHEKLKIKKQLSKMKESRSKYNSNSKNKSNKSNNLIKNNDYNGSSNEKNKEDNLKDNIINNTKLVVNSINDNINFNKNINKDNAQNEVLTNNNGKASNNEQCKELFENGIPKISNNNLEIHGNYSTHINKNKLNIGYNLNGDKNNQDNTNRNHKYPNSEDPSKKIKIEIKIANQKKYEKSVSEKIQKYNKINIGLLNFNGLSGSNAINAKPAVYKSSKTFNKSNNNFKNNEINNNDNIINNNICASKEISNKDNLSNNEFIKAKKASEKMNFINLRKNINKEDDELFLKTSPEHKVKLEEENISQTNLNKFLNLSNYFIHERSRSSSNKKKEKPLILFPCDESSIPSESKPNQITNKLIPGYIKINNDDSLYDENNPSQKNSDKNSSISAKINTNLDNCPEIIQTESNVKNNKNLGLLKKCNANINDYKTLRTYNKIDINLDINTKANNKNNEEEEKYFVIHRYPEPNENKINNDNNIPNNKTNHKGNFYFKEFEKEFTNCNNNIDFKSDPLTIVNDDIKKSSKITSNNDNISEKTKKLNSNNKLKKLIIVQEFESCINSKRVHNEIKLSGFQKKNTNNKYNTIDHNNYKNVININNDLSSLRNINKINKNISINNKKGRKGFNIKDDNKHNLLGINKKGTNNYFHKSVNNLFYQSVVKEELLKFGINNSKQNESFSYFTWKLNK